MPPRITECRHEGCTEPPLDQAIFCGTHIGMTRRCKATRAGSGKKQRCKKPALVGLEVCERHGGSFPQAQKQSGKAVALTTMQRFVRPYEGDLNPITAFEMEFRRTLGRIEWYDEQLALLNSEEDLIWGVTKEEHISAGEFPGTNTTKEARVNILEEMQRWERKHLLDLEKVWINAGLEREKLDLMRSHMGRFRQIVDRVVTALGHDPHDPETRATLAAIFAQGEEPRHLAARQVAL